MSPLLLTINGCSALIYALLAATETAMSALPPSRLAVLHEQTEGQEKQRLGRFLDEPVKLRRRWLVGRVLCSGVSFVTSLQMLSDVPEGPRPWVAAGVTLLVLALLSELTSAVARARPASVGPRLLALMRPFELVVLLLADPLSRLGRALSDWLADPDSADEPALAEAEVEHMVDDAAKAGQLEPEPAEMIRNVLDLKDLIVRDVMIPRIKMVAIEVDTPLLEVVRLVASEAHSRYPVYGQVVDNIMGLLYARDLLKLVEGGFEGRTLREILHAPVNFIPDTQPVATVLRDMRSRRQHMAILVDEFGGVSGLVTLEDLLERIVGDIRDEFDHEEAPIQDLGSGRLLADASVSLADLSTYLGTEIEGSGDYGSLGGLLMHEAGRVPSVGDSISSSGLEFIVREGDAKRIVKVEILLPPASVSASTAPPPAS